MSTASQIVSNQFITYPDSDSSYIPTHIIQIRTTQRRIIGFWTNTHTHTHTRTRTCMNAHVFSASMIHWRQLLRIFIILLWITSYFPNSTSNVTVGVHNKPHICDVGEIRDVGERQQLVALGRSEPFTTNHICDAVEMSTEINIKETYTCVDVCVSLHAYVFIIHNCAYICIYAYERVHVYVSWFTFGSRLWVFAYGHPSVVEYISFYSRKYITQLMLFDVK